MLKRVIQKTAELAGIEAIPSWRLESLPLATKLERVFAHYNIETVLDIGANTGQYHDFLRAHVGFQGLVHSFEPDPDLAGPLMQRARGEGDRWEVHQLALGASPSHATFNRMSNSQFNSFHTPAAGQPGQFSEFNKVVAAFPVEVTTLDSLLGLFGDLSRVYVKIDTQGFDLEVLAGGRQVMAAVPGLQTEVSCRPIYDGSPDFAASLAAFQQAGFEVCDLFLISSDEHLRAVEFDCLMVRAQPGSARAVPAGRAP